MPYHITDLNDEGRKYVMCEYCHEWYHRECIDIPSKQLDPFINNDIKYICQRCQENGITLTNVTNSSASTGKILDAKAVVRINLI